MEQNRNGGVFLHDNEIIRLFFKRDEKAIFEAGEKYGKYCLSVADNLLHCSEDSEECLNSALLVLWNSIPPKSPDNLKLFFAKIIRNIALEKFRSKNAKKRGSGEKEELFDELSEFIPSGENVEDEVISRELEESIKCFAKKLPEKERNIFIRRYFFFETPDQIAKKYGFSENGVCVVLHRVRKKLRSYLEKEGYIP